MFVGSNLMMASSSVKGGVFEVYSSRRTNTEQPGYAENEHAYMSTDATVVEWHYTWGAAQIAIAESVYVDIGENRVGVLDFRNHQFNWSADRINNRIRFYDENKVLLGSMTHYKYSNTWSRTDNNAMQTNFYDAAGTFLYKIGGSLWSGTSYGCGQTSGIMYLRDPNAIYINPEGQNSTAHQNNVNQTHVFAHGLALTRFVTVEMYAQSSTYSGANGTGNTYVQAGAQGSLYRPSTLVVENLGLNTLIPGKDFPLGVPFKARVWGSGGNGGYTGSNDTSSPIGGSKGGGAGYYVEADFPAAKVDDTLDLFIGISDLGFGCPPGAGCQNGCAGNNGQESEAKLTSGANTTIATAAGGVGGDGGACNGDYIQHYSYSGTGAATDRYCVPSPSGGFWSGMYLIWDGVQIAAIQNGIVGDIVSTTEGDFRIGADTGNMTPGGVNPPKPLYYIERRESSTGTPGENSTYYNATRTGNGGSAEVAGSMFGGGGGGTNASSGSNVAGALGGQGGVVLEFDWENAE